jgi:outer membrane protein OmpA-like peptidoglycan-associated protein
MRSRASDLFRPIPASKEPSQLSQLSQNTRRAPIINAPGDAYEQEANRVAGQVLSGAGHDRLQARPVRETSETAAPPAVQEVLSSSGQPLDSATRELMESRFGHDFGNVRVHADTKATESARQIDASAYTSGSDIVFGQGRYETGTPSGQRLLAHELTHVVQQTGQTGATGAGQVIQRQPASGSGTLQVPSIDLRENMSPSMAGALGSTSVDQFALGSAKIPIAGEDSLRSAAENILFFLKKYPGSTVQITGHTDLVDTETRNLTLGQERADAVSAFLQKEGVPAEVISTDSKGESAPVVATKNGVAEGRNRRVNVFFRVNKMQIPLGFDTTLKPPTAGTAPPQPPIPIPTGIPPTNKPFEEPTLDEKMRELDRKLKNAYKPPAKKSVSDVVIDGVINEVVSPILKKVGLSDKRRKQAEDLVRKGLEAGTEKACDAAVDSLSVGSSEKEALKAACKAAIKQKPK